MAQAVDSRLSSRGLAYLARAALGGGSPRSGDLGAKSSAAKN